MMVNEQLAQVVYPCAQATPPTAPLTAGTADTTSFTGYDANGNLLGRVDGRGINTSYSYADPESRLTGISYAYPNGYTGGTAGSVSLGYDGYGRRSSMSDGTGSQTYSYDDASDLTSKAVTWTGLSPKTISYAFYPNGNRSGMTADGQAFSYGYDKDGRLTGLVNPSSEPSAWTYQDNGRLATRALNNSAGSLVVGTTYTRNQLGEVMDLLNQSGTGTTLSEFGSMAYDGAGNRTTLTASVPGNTAYSGTTSYAYDYAQTANPTLNRGQLTGESSQRGGTYTNVFGYDGGTGTGPGNPTSFKGATNTFNTDNQITNAGYGYDGAGNPTTYQTKALTFDPENRLTQYGPSASPTQTDGYSGDGLRAWKSSAGGTTYFLYDGTQPVCEYSVTGTPASAVLSAVNTFGADGLVSRHTSGGSTFYAFDERGNVAQRVSSSGAVQSSDLYDGYGARSSTGGADVWGFEAQYGYYTDGETGLLLCTHRFYDPGAGRWLTRDPIGYRGGIDLYEYTANNPANEIDPNGTDLWTGINNVLGFLLGLGGSTAYDPSNDAYVISDSPFMTYWAFIQATTGGDPWAMTIGNNVLLPPSSDGGPPIPPEIYDHELCHIDQANELGPTYLYVYGVGWFDGIGAGDAWGTNPMEIDADNRSGNSNPNSGSGFDSFGPTFGELPTHTGRTGLPSR